MRIGLVGGLALNAGIHYYRALAERMAALERPLDLVLSHADTTIVLDHVARGESDALAAYLAGHVDALQQAGAGVGAISAVTPHVAIDALRERVSLPLVDILKTTASAVSGAGYARVALFGTRAAMASRLFGALEADRVVDLGDEVRDAIHDLYTDIAQNAKVGTKPERVSLERLAALAMDHGAKAIVLAGTDLSSFYATSPAPYPHIDAARVHIDAIASFAPSTSSG